MLSHLIFLQISSEPTVQTLNHRRGRSERCEDEPTLGTSRVPDSAPAASTSSDNSSRNSADTTRINESGRPTTSIQTAASPQKAATAGQSRNVVVSPTRNQGQGNRAGPQTAATGGASGNASTGMGTTIARRENLTLQPGKVNQSISLFCKTFLYVLSFHVKYPDFWKSCLHAPLPSDL